MKIKKFNENSNGVMRPDNTYSIYDRNESQIVELYLTESESSSREKELNTEFNIELNHRVRKSIGDKPPLNISRYCSQLLSKSIEELSDYLSDLYSEHDESF